MNVVLTFLKRSSPAAPAKSIGTALLVAPLLAGAIYLVTSKRSRAARGVSLKTAEHFAKNLTGRSRRHVHRLLGDPVTTVGRDHWYYPVNAREKIALAITFAADRVSAATILQTPPVARAAAHSPLRS